MYNIDLYIYIGNHVQTINTYHSFMQTQILDSWVFATSDPSAPCRTIHLAKRAWTNICSIQDSKRSIPDMKCDTSVTRTWKISNSTDSPPHRLLFGGIIVNPCLIAVGWYVFAICTGAFSHCAPFSRALIKQLKVLHMHTNTNWELCNIIPLTY